MKRLSLFCWAALGLLALVRCSGGADSRKSSGGSDNPGLATSRAALGAPPICTAADLATCASQNLATEQCLTLYQACGRYWEIIDHYKSEAWSSDLNKWYYVGAAYHGLFVLNRSAAAKCQFGTAARLALQSYLHESYKNQGYNDQRVFQQSYHATKLLEAVKDLDGCEDDGATPDELYNATYAHGKELAEGLFLGDPPPGPMRETLARTKTSIQNSIRGFVSKASNIETQIGLRKVAMDESDARILKIANLFLDPSGFGANVALTTDAHGKKPTISSATLPATSPFVALQALYLPNRGINARASGMLARITAALGAVSISDYESKRTLIVGYARDALASSASSLDRATKETSPEQMKAIQDGTAAANRAGDDGAGPFQTVKAQWKAYGDTTHACSQASPPWYCK